MSVRYHHGDVASAALVAARRAAAEGGAPGVRMRGVAREIGVSHPALLHHFGSRHGLLAAVARAGFTELDGILEGVLGHVDGPRERFGAVGVAYVQFALQHPGTYRLMFHRDSVSRFWDGDIEPVAESCFGRLSRALDGAWPGIVADDVATLAWSTVHGAVMLWLDGPFQQRRTGATSPLEVAAMLASTLPFPESP